jgi:hypothetical protein
MLSSKLFYPRLNHIIFDKSKQKKKDNETDYETSGSANRICVGLFIAKSAGHKKRNRA